MQQKNLALIRRSDIMVVINNFYSEEYGLVTSDAADE